MTIESIVAAGAKEVTTGVGFAGYTYMQDVDKSKCDSSSIPIGTEGRLIDKRDNKVYWVAKLKDGLCWMTQNLDYDGGAMEGYNGSDVADFIAGTVFNNDTANIKQYYDPGEYIYTQGSIKASCDSNTNTGLDACTSYGWISKSELFANWQSTDDPNFVDSASYPSTDGRETCTKATGSVIGNSGQYLYCNLYYGSITNTEHYLVGNYYNWPASINEVTPVSGDVDTSICPTGWKLPTSNSTTALGSFGLLVNGSLTSAITVKPLYFVSSGQISGSILNNASSSGYYWSATSTYALSFFYNTDKVTPSYSLNRYYGCSVRCVAR